jgi:hypothetical protein
VDVLSLPVVYTDAQYHGILNTNDDASQGWTLYSAGDGNLYAQARMSGTRELSLGAFTAGVYAIAATCDTTGVFAAINGTLKSSVAAGNIPTGMNQSRMGQRVAASTPDGAQHLLRLFFDRQLTDSEMQLLTGSNVRSAVSQ